MRLYSYWRSSASYRARIVLASKHIEYEYVPVDISKKTLEQRAPRYEEINAMQRVPVLEWTEDGHQRRLTESVAICEYLNERWPAPPLLPERPFERACVREAVEIINSGIQPLQNQSLFSGDGTGAPDRISQGLRALESRAHACGAPYFAGETPTLADVFLVPQLYSARRFGVRVEEYPKLHEIERRALSLEAFAAAHPDRQLDAPRETSEGGRRLA